jgi:hypothetical protein
MRKTIVQSLALGLAARYERDYAEYVEACEQDRREGFRPHYCEHGTNCWTDYDNICGPCEDGITMRDGVQRRERALAEAKRRDVQAKKIIQAAYTLSGEGVELDFAPVWAKVGTLLDPTSGW